MKRLPILITTLSLLLASFISMAQTTSGKITGSVTDTQKAIEAATVNLLKAKDSTVVKFAITSKTGNFEIDLVKDGNYLISIQAVGFQKYYSSPFTVTAGSADQSFSKIELVPSSNKLQDVTVASKKPLIEQKIDRTIVNVDASPTNVGSSALEVLEKSPGISVDKDGNISLKGKEGVMVLIDNRPTQLSGADLANLLRSMNANQLDQIEIMTNPPAKYDAAGNAGIINIKTKKTKTFGYNGSVTVGYGQGVYPKANEAITFNYRQGKINLFSNVSHNFHKGFGELDIERNFINKTSKVVESHFEQKAKMSRQSNSFNGKVGVDYFATKKTTFGLVLSGYSSKSDNENKNINDLYAPPSNYISQTRSLSLQDDKWQNFSSNFNFRHVLDKTGKEITADVDYIVYDAEQFHTLTNAYFTPSGVSTRKADTLYGTLPQVINIYSGKVDYLHPLKNGARFEAGLKTSIVRTDNNAQYDSLVYGVLVRDLNRSNHFIYEENINAAYANLSGSLSKKWSGQLGLRMENTIAKGKQKTTGQDFERNYTQLFPTAYLQYKANEKNSFVLNYGRRIRRPNYGDLNPFIEFLDRYTYEQGNPNLKPQFSHNVELSHTFKGFLTTTLNYTKTNDILQMIMDQIPEDTITFVKKENIASQRQFGLSISAGMPITKWWTSNLYVNVFNNHFEGVVGAEKITVDATMLSLNGSQQFKLNKTASVEISGWYRTAGIESVLKTKPMGMVALGFSQQVMKGKGTLRLNIRDIFYTQQFSAVSKYGHVDAGFTQRNDSRVVNIGFTYRFNKGKLKASQGRKSGSASDEQNRVGGGS